MADVGSGDSQRARGIGDARANERHGPSELGHGDPRERCERDVALRGLGEKADTASAPRLECVEERYGMRERLRDSAYGQRVSETETGPLRDEVPPTRV